MESSADCYSHSLHKVLSQNVFGLLLLCSPVFLLLFSSADAALESSMAKLISHLSELLRGNHICFHPAPSQQVEKQILRPSTFAGLPFPSSHEIIYSRTTT
ncbi:unnamed protein product [Heterobilharzia americana]|nr:unnamed protein product [Heterobilharzia americana]